MNKNDLRYIKTEELIQNAFFESVEEVGFEKTTVSDICKLARISRFTFYSHHEDKYRLKEHILSVLEKNLRKSLTRSIVSDYLRGDFQSSANRIVNDAISNKNLIRIMMKCDRNAVIKIIANEYMDYPTTTYIKDSKQKIDSDLELQVARAFLVNSIIGFIDVVINSDDDISKEELTQVMYNLCKQPSETFFNRLIVK